MELTTYTTNPTTDAAAIHRYVKGMRELGWHTLRLSDGEVTRSVDSDEATSDVVADLTAVDESSLVWTKDGKRCSMHFVLGNSPDEVLCDCSVDDGNWDDDLRAVESAIYPAGQ